MRAVGAIIFAVMLVARTHAEAPRIDRALGSLRAAACTYRIALGPRAGQKVVSLQTVPSQAEPPTEQRCVNAQGFSLHAEVCCAAHQRKKLESQGQGLALLGAPRTQHCAATSPVPRYLHLAQRHLENTASPLDLLASTPKTRSGR